MAHYEVCSRCFTEVNYSASTADYYAFCPEHDEDLYKHEVTTRLGADTLADVATVTIETATEGNAWEKTGGRTYTLQVTNARGAEWGGVPYAVGSALTHNGDTVRHPSVEEILDTLHDDHNIANQEAVKEDFVSHYEDEEYAAEVWDKMQAQRRKFLEFFTMEERALIAKVAATEF